MLRDVGAGRVDSEAAIALAVREADAEGLKVALVAAGYLPADRAASVDAELAQRLMRHAIRWYAVPGARRFSVNGEQRSRHREQPDLEQRADIKNQVNQFAMPPESILIRPMHAVVAVVLRNLRAGADWGAIAAEYLHGAPPATPLGQAEADVLARRHR